MFSDIVDILFDLLAIKYYDSYKGMFRDQAPILTTMILNYNKLGKQNKGGSLIFSAQGGRGKEKNYKPAAKKFASPSEGEAEGGCGGNSASPEPKRSPAALLVQSRAQQKSFLFLLEEKIGRAQIKKCEENFFAGWRAPASGGGTERQSSQSGFSSKKVRILSKRYRHLSSRDDGAEHMLGAGLFEHSRAFFHRGSGSVDIIHEENVFPSYGPRVVSAKHAPHA